MIDPHRVNSGGKARSALRVVLRSGTGSDEATGRKAHDAQPLRIHAKSARLLSDNAHGLDTICYDHRPHGVHLVAMRTWIVGDLHERVIVVGSWHDAVLEHEDRDAARIQPARDS